MSLAPPDCTPKCRSQQHADQVIAALTGGSERQLKAFLTSYCHNATTLRDAFGRTALHLAASQGKKALLEWLLESKGSDLMVKDKESGWTALHRSAFYGQIHCLTSLIKHGGLISTQDKEGFSVLDLTMKDRPAHVVFRDTDPTEVYTWGNNTNFSLGHGNQESRQHPELVDVFARSGVYIKQVVLCKFHSVFLSQKGQVFTCGHGQGGRLGHGDEQTYLVPRMVEGLMSHHCSQVAAAKDHTVVLTEEGYVYTFGLNTFHQLGLTPPPASAHVPKQVFAKMLKGRVVIGVAAGRFHTVLWTREAVYTMGLNGGQLGYLLDPNGEKCVTTPRQVSALHHKEVSIAKAAASDGATAVVTQRGDVYLLADYQCKKMASRQLNIKKVLVSGGSLDHRVAPQVLKEGGAEKVSILALNEAGRVFCWRSSGSSVRQCRWAYPRQVFMSDIALSKNGMMFVTPDGEGFSGMWAGEQKKCGEKKEVCGHSDSGTPYERIRLEKLPFVHRAVGITMDSKGRNFGVLQADPRTSLFEVPSISASTFSQHFQNLLEEADETDNIHDVTLQAGNHTFPAHKYILSMRSDFFRKLFVTDHRGDEEELDKEVRRSEDAVGCDLLILEKIPADMLEYALRFMYTDSCELLVHGARAKTSGLPPAQNQQEKLISSLQVLGLRDRSALEVYRSLSPSTKEDNNKAKNKGSKAGKKAKGGKGDKAAANEGGANPVKSLQAVAKKLGLGSLSARLDGVKYENGKISVMQKKSSSKPKFYQKKCSYLCDVTLKSEDGKEFPCHKSVLCARLEYFSSMLGSSWMEATSCSALEMPTSSEILQVILEYIYTDESPTIKECQNVEFVCNVLVVADQLLITRLKEMCEVVITENCMLYSSFPPPTDTTLLLQLKLSCLQFISLNMAALLESKALDVLSDEVLVELSAAYRRLIPAMQKRIITPYPDAPDLSLYEEEDLDSAFGTKPETELDQSCREILLKKAKIKAKKKPRRRSDSSGGYTLSDIIQSPPPAVVSPFLGKSAKANSTESLQELLTSDSEGSCMGAGSPRDMQSPVFDTRTEVNFNSPVFYLLTCFSACAYSSKPSPVSSKLSQKQRKMLAMVSKEPGGESPGPRTHKHSSFIAHRATAIQSPPSSCSFRALLEEEESNSVRAEEPRSQRAQTALGSPVSATPAIKRVTFKCAENGEPERPTGPWVLGAASSPPLSSLVTFASIVEEEKQQEAALIRSREKPLALIQIEERAIQDLLLHYWARDNPDELIVVERSSTGPMAAPTWHKH
uniref:Inhibitor of Bruton agammaglobulinemia tyrosine kinase n=1 Tax=Oryzias melastigma TaxID=30732 RepID=A0A3B3BGL0_ORYME